MFEIQYSSKSVKQLKKLDKPVQKQIIKAIEKISKNPFLSKPLSNVFKRFRSEHVGKYRILFSVKANTLVIVKIEHRKKVYK